MEKKTFSMRCERLSKDTRAKMKSNFIQMLLNGKQQHSLLLGIRKVFDWDFMLTISLQLVKTILNKYLNSFRFWYGYSYPRNLFQWKKSWSCVFLCHHIDIIKCINNKQWKRKNRCLIWRHQMKKKKKCWICLALTYALFSLQRTK